MAAGEPSMKEKKKTLAERIDAGEVIIQKQAGLGTRIFIFALLILLAGNVGANLIQYRDAEKAKSLVPVEVKEKNRQIYELTAANADLKEDYNALEAEYNNFKEKHVPSGDRDKKAVMAYIKNNYRRVPKEIVDSIAVNVITKSIQHNVPYELIVGIIEVESDFNPTAVSKAGARGLMQVRQEVWGKTFGVADKFSLHEVDVGIDLGIRVLKHYLAGKDGGIKGDISQALYLYVGKNKDYVKQVLTSMGTFVLFKASFNSTPAVPIATEDRPFIKGYAGSEKK